MKTKPLMMDADSRDLGSLLPSQLHARGDGESSAASTFLGIACLPAASGSPRRRSGGSSHASPGFTSKGGADRSGQPRLGCTCDAGSGGQHLGSGSRQVSPSSRPSLSIVTALCRAFDRDSIRRGENAANVRVGAFGKPSRRKALHRAYLPETLPTT
jgi:hypothetical protein